MLNDPCAPVKSKRGQRWPILTVVSVALVIALGGGIVLVCDISVGRRAGKILRPLARQGTLEGTGGILAWNVDSRLIATPAEYWFESTDVLIWDSRSSRIIHSLGGHSACVLALEWSPSGTALASGSRDGTVIVWDPVSGKQLAHLQGHEGAVFDLAWDPNGKRLASCDSTGAVIIWSTLTGESLADLKGHNASVVSIAWSPNGTKVATRSRDGSIKIWDTTARRCLFTLDCSDDPQLDYRYQPLVWSPDGKFLSATSGSACIVWDPFTGVKRAELPMKSAVAVIAWSPDSTVLATGSDDGAWWRGVVRDVLLPPRAEVILWDAGTWSPVAVLDTTGKASAVTDIEWSPDGLIVAMDFANDYTIEFWDVKSKTWLGSTPVPSHTLSDIGWSSNGEFLAAATVDGDTIVWKGPTVARVQ